MLQLDVGLPRSTWAAWLGCLLPTVLLANLPAVLLGWMLFGGSEVVAVLLPTPVLLLDALFVLMLLHHYRNTYWLDGRVLVRRLVFGHRRYDLSYAQVSAETARPVWANRRSGALPRLIVRVPGSAPAKVWLRNPARQGALLPPGQLAALAKAVDPDLRHPVAGRLWQLASDPLPGIA